MKSISAEDVMTIPIDLLLRSTRGASDIAKKRRKTYEDSIMDRYLDDVEANDGSWLGMDVLANGGQPPQVGFHILFACRGLYFLSNASLSFSHQSLIVVQGKEDRVRNVRWRMNEGRFGSTLLERTSQEYVYLVLTNRLLGNSC